MKLTLVICLLALVCATSETVASNWPSDPTVNLPVANGPFEHLAPRIATDGWGGAIIGWQDLRSFVTLDDVYAQRISKNGDFQWTAQGVPVCIANSVQKGVRIITDGQGGAILAWVDVRNDLDWDVYAQRIDFLGNPLWTINGVPVATLAADQTEVELVSDGAGGTIVVWTDSRAGQGDIYAQRIDFLGSPLWTVDGIAISTQANDQVEPQITVDGQGGAIVIWRDARDLGTTSYDIYAQRVDANGNVLWTADGVPTSGPLWDWMHQIISDDAGGAIVVWSSNGDDDIYVQRIDPNGATAWTAGGVAVCTEAGSQIFPQLLGDGSSGAFLSWSDSRPVDDGIYASRVDSAGTILWGVCGAPVSLGPNSKDRPRLATDDAGGVIITWQDSRNVQFNPDIYAQRMDGSGNPVWTVDGVAIAIASRWQSIPYLVPDGSGGAIITWEDQRAGEFAVDVYAQQVGADGQLGSVPTGIPPNAGERLPAFVMRSASPNPFSQFTEVRFELVGAATITIGVYDVSGRRVASSTLSSRAGSEGTYRFDGRDINDQPLPSGVYFLRAQADGFTDTQKILIVR